MDLLLSFLSVLEDASRLFSGESSVDEDTQSCRRDEALPKVSILAVDKTCKNDRRRVRAVVEAPWRERTFDWVIQAGDGELFANEVSGQSLRVDEPAILFEGLGYEPLKIGVRYRQDGQWSDWASHEVKIQRCARLPRIIHFVWAGGEKIMVEAAFETVVGWYKTNRKDGFQVWIWVDSKSDPKVEEKYSKSYEVLFGSKGIRLRDIQELRYWGDIAGHVRYEIDRLWPNYGASSDMIRYAALREHGGAYFDTDVPPNKPLNHRGVFDDPLPDWFVASDDSQASKSIGNDTFICSAEHPLMRDILRLASSHYEESGYSRQGHRNNARSYNSFEYRMNSTVERTGPTVVARALLEKNLLEGPVDPLRGGKIVSYIREDTTEYYINRLPAKHRIDPGVLNVTEEESNTLGWMRVPVKQMDFQDAVEVAARSMIFEIQVMGMLRLVSHVSEIAIAAGIELEGATQEYNYKRYKIRYFEVDEQKKETPGEAEHQIATALFKRLVQLDALDPRQIKKRALKNPNVLEPECRYKVFEKFYNACKPG